jgi:hypothetical protein
MAVKPLPYCLRLPPSPTHSGRRSLGHVTFITLQVLFGIVRNHLGTVGEMRTPSPSWCGLDRTHLWPTGKVFGAREFPFNHDRLADAGHFPAGSIQRFERFHECNPLGKLLGIV